VAYVPERVVFERPRNGGRVFSALDQPNTWEELLTIDWYDVLHNGRPDPIPADAWGAVVYNLHHPDLGYGDYWADYVAEMAENANYLAGVGQTTSSLEDLWGFEVAQASASLSPVRYLAGAVDVSVPTPGLPLSFSRVYCQDIASRFENAYLGRGWSHNWDVYAEVQTGGDVILRGPGDVDRFFH
jgi:hypothetical protein